MRAQTSGEVVLRYAEAMRDGATFPPVRAVWDGTDYWLWDGFHRYFACAEAGITTLTVEVTDGTLRQARLLAIGANAEPRAFWRSNADKQVAINVMLTDDEWGQWSDHTIAQKCGVHHRTVAAARACLPGLFDKAEAEEDAGTAPDTVTGSPAATAPVAPEKLAETVATEVALRNTLHAWGEQMQLLRRKLADAGANRTAVALARALDALASDTNRLLTRG